MESSSSGSLELLSRLLLDRAEPSAAGLYECEASAEQPDQLATGADRLRRTFGLAINGK